MGKIKFTDTQKKLAEQLILTVINRESHVEYHELAERIDLPVHYANVGKDVDVISEICHKLNLPLISAKVLKKGGSAARAEFFVLMSKLGINHKEVESREIFALELKKIRECKDWYKLADYFGLNMDLPRETVGFSEVAEKAETTPKTTKTHAPLKSIKNPTPSAKWLAPCNSNLDIILAHKYLDEIDRQQTVGFKEGDIVFIYCSKPYHKVMFQTVVKRTDIPFTEKIDDTKFWKSPRAVSRNVHSKYVRLEFLKYLDSNVLSLESLKQAGLQNAPKSPVRLTKTLCEYLGNEFDKAVPIEKISVSNKNS